MRARYYDPVSQQFISRDPADAASGQAHTYAGGDLLNISDLTGLGEPGEDDEEGGKPELGRQGLRFPGDGSSMNIQGVVGYPCLSVPPKPDTQYSGCLFANLSDYKRENNNHREADSSQDH